MINEELIQKAINAQNEARQRLHFRKIEYRGVSPFWILTELPDLQPWSRSGDMVLETMPVHRYTSERDVREAISRKIIEATLMAVLPC